MRIYCLVPLLFAVPSLGSLFGSDSSSTTSASSSSSSSTSSSTTSDEVAFLQTLQAAEISSMSCLITLVNMTTSSLGSCLALTSLANVISNPSSSSSSSIASGGQGFSDQLDTYLRTVCSSTCSGRDLQDGKSQLAAVCDTSNTLVSVLDAVLDNYSSSYRTLACQVYYNGTSQLCLPSTLNTSTTANSYTFFDALVSGSSSNLETYQDSVFTQAECTGCMYEMFKAAQYTIPNIRGQSLTETFANHLKNDCPSSSSGDNSSTSSIDWSDVDDQQIPDSLEVGQNTQITASSGAVVGVAVGVVGGGMLGTAGIAGAVGMVWIL
ncbi:hypothetical protein C343_02373 [Cryptococcus neoformans C23]|uniref:Uncharacterized protein n=1 Tax=Cryptococcus neoformans (strain H99 / ATCC 208821 / CBS 10515 / FGSC 9487) TaxID=235443 RepID=J9VIM3_CRYN9|nr:hypothetical protein CNAG_05037 [Cryptococcus neoformans var. grubii H99]AUB23942.1 hypothetical protein CKF44_05037 [Cryptococcus neoformans var. grubii]OWZ33420.1 hypothetical protein C347_02441 [Cryptococcus neoformans var. grubii AD2-60a]OWZ45516.1 hypothetical protein C343_02373 [Cryptococcus neoformans var. grubii C23]OXC85577.1 hypothetical protein C344_02181 [Cryptococcus neoformans var. grubii AD1-7a]AFR94302.2 hypothetical protein CNAG_05037 [Cryptococcus neoformans var. grubii H9|eukprot:XP_012048472.1 hypothetical protein CNAG_05037 [Cryptococcus neoformans var. grubii H99]